VKNSGLTTAQGHEGDVFDVLRSELEKAGGDSVPGQRWQQMSLADRKEWLETELVRLQARVQAKVHVDG
jgi:hypothetical protein